MKIVDMEDIAHLQTFTSKTRIGEWAAKQVSSHPQHNESLIYLTHLPGT